jgi:hypothetical protein
MDEKQRTGGSRAQPLQTAGVVFVVQQHKSHVASSMCQLEFLIPDSCNFNAEGVYSRWNPQTMNRLWQSDG